MAQTQCCFGKKAPIFDRRTLHFGAYLTPALPGPPEAVNWGKNVKSWPMYLNDRYADCTCAAAGHMIQNWTAAVKRRVRPSEQQVLKFYEQFTKPGPHNSVHALKVLKHWRSIGLAGHKIKAFAQLELRNVTEVKDAISIFGGCYIGVELPKFVTAAAAAGKHPRDSAAARTARRRRARSKGTACCSGSPMTAATFTS